MTESNSNAPTSATPSTESAATPKSPASPSSKTGKGGESFASNLNAVLAKARNVVRAPEPAEGADEDDAQAPSPSAASGAKSDDEPEKRPAKAQDGGEDDAEEKGPKVDEDPKLAAKFAALARKSAKVREAESKIAAERDRLNERERSLARSEQQVAAMVTSYREFEAAKGDPSRLLAYLERQGISLDKAVEHHLRAQDPEYQRARAAERTQSELEELRKRLDTERQQRERETNEARATREREESERAFLDMSADEEKFGAANAVYTDAEKLRVAWHIDQLAKSKGLRWGLQEIAEAVEEFAANGYELDSRGNAVKSERLAKKLERFRSNGAPPQSTAAPAATALPPGNSRHVTPARTLTNSVANERASEADLSDLPLDERIKRLAARARSGPRVLT